MYRLFQIDAAANCRDREFPLPEHDYGDCAPLLASEPLLNTEQVAQLLGLTSWFPGAGSPLVNNRLMIR
jgi:hypothetical protein